MTRIIYFISLYLFPLFAFGQSDNPSTHLNETHIQLIRDNKRWFLRTGEAGQVVYTPDGIELAFTDLPEGTGGDSISVLQDSIIVLYAGGIEISRDTVHGTGTSGSPGASTLADISDNSDDGTKSTYTMTSTVPVEFESSDNNTILLLDETNERVDASNIRIAGLTASQLIATDADKDLVSLSTATYPSLTELSYVKGVTSAIQTQIDTKVDGTGSSGYLSKFTDSNTLGSSTFHENTAGFVTNIDRGVSVGDLVSSTAAGSGFRLQRGTLTGGYFATSSDMYFQTTSNHSLRFRVNATETMMLHTSNQAVSIGTTSIPTARVLIHDATLAASGSLNGNLLDLTQTWNTTGAPTAIKLNVTNTASGAAARLLDLQIASTTNFHINKSGGLYALGSGGFGIVTPISKLHVYQDNSNTDSTVGLTIEQDGTGDALEHFLLTGGRRWTVGIDNSDADKYKVMTDNADYLEIDDNAQTMALSINGAEKINISRTKTNVTNAIRYSGILDASVWAAQVDDWTPSGGDSCSIFLIEMTGGSQTITGMNLTNVSGLTVKLINEDGADSIYIAHEDLSSTSSYRFALESGNDLIIPPSGCAECIYSPNVSRWRCWKLWFFLLPFRFRKRKAA